MRARCSVLFVFKVVLAAAAALALCLMAPGLVQADEPVPAPGCAVDPLSAILSLPADERDDPRVAGEIENVLTRVLGGDHEGNR